MTVSVLLVDDSADTRTLVARELGLHFAELAVIHAGTAKELDKAIQDGHFDVAITDYRLRFSDGITVLRRLKQDYPERPVIMFTASGSEEIAVTAMKEGLDDYITKTPKHFPRIAFAVRSCLGKIDQRRQLEQALARLEKADRQKNEFLSILAHELRNPLAAAGYSVALMRQDDAPAATLKRATDVMERQIAHMARLLDQLLDLSRITRNRVDLVRQPIDLRRLIEQCIDNLRPALHAGAHELTVTLPDDPLVVDGDEVRLTQVFSNVLHNATKFSPPGGRIALRAVLRGAEAVVEVQDHGIGIDQSRLEDVFEMFSQAETKAHGGTPGLGIGLAIVRSLVELHGGSARAYSDGAGRGTTVQLVLPLAGDATLAEPVQAKPATSAGGALQVLVADDNLDAADLLAEVLRTYGYAVHTAHDGKAAIELAARFKPDVMVLDIGMPGATGYEVAHWTREQPWGERVALIAVTGWGQEHDGNRALRAGFDARLVKPVDLDELLKLIALAAMAVPQHAS
jgi:two-component system CheB/CheR fusion protein